MQNNRRHFLKTLGAGFALSAIPSYLKAGLKNPKDDRLIVLHTNDTHSHIDPFEDDPKFKGQGGFARRASMVENIRKSFPNVLLLDSGDIFQGTPYFNLFGGELELKLMSKLGYDAATMGNHDFDNGLEGFKKVLPEAKFPFLTANYDFTQTLLDEMTKPYTILNKGSWKIGIFGLGIDLKGLVGKKEQGGVRYLDPIGIAQDITRKLKKEHCDLIICLSHLGYHYTNNKVSDKVLATQTQDIDLILGGHTHTFLKQPETLKNAIGQDVIINQCGFGGILLGRIDFIKQPNAGLQSIAWQNQPVQDPHI